jgi:large subunit ribosomal protein L21
VAPGAAVRVERLPGEVGEAIELAEVLLIGGEGDTRIGTPLLDGAKVRGTITAQGRSPKIVVYKQKRRKNYRVKQGHRQDFTEITVESIDG